jgi:hypothetical protein
MLKLKLEVDCLHAQGVYGVSPVSTEKLSDWPRLTQNILARLMPQISACVRLPPDTTSYL